MGVKVEKDFLGSEEEEELLERSTTPDEFDVVEGMSREIDRTKEGAGVEEVEEKEEEEAEE